VVPGSASEIKSKPRLSLRGDRPIVIAGRVVGWEPNVDDDEPINDE
jgi:hypothetical protein